MLTDKGNSWNELLGFRQVHDAVDNKKHLSLPVGKMLDGLEYDSVELIDKVPLFIQQEKRGSKTLEKHLLRIEHHRQQLCDAIVALVDCYNGMTKPQTRTSSALKAKQDMLSMMPDKVLRDFAKAVGIDGKDYVLPDEKTQFIAAVIEAMNGDGEE